MSSDMVYQRQYMREVAENLDDPDLLDRFLVGKAEVFEGIDSYEANYQKLAQLIRKSLSDRQTNPAILTRRYAAAMQRLQKLDQSISQVCRGYANIWESLEESLAESPLKALSEKARAGGKAKAAKAKDKPNPEREAATKLATDQPTLSATQIKMRLGLRASDRTIRGWIAAAKQ